MVDLNTDLDLFVNPLDFAESATYIPFGGSPVSITGIYDDQTIEDQGEAEVGERGSQPTFGCKTSDIPNAGHDDTLVVSGQSHKVVGVDKDGTGVTTLILEKQ